MSRWFEAGLTCLAFCWRLDRRDGVTLGLTSHDHDLMFNGLRFRAMPGIIPSALERTAGLESDSVQLTGALTLAAIRAADLSAGCWDGARLRLWAVDWTQADQDPLLLMGGRLGAVDMEDGRFSVELAGASAALDGPANPSTSPYCRAQLGDRQCRVDMAGRSCLATVQSVAGGRVTLAPEGLAGVDRAQFVHGRLRWADGPYAGLATQIIGAEGGDLLLADAPVHAMPDPVRVELTQGCDRRFATCSARFANAANFRGEPHLPGADLLLRYGG